MNKKVFTLVFATGLTFLVPAYNRADGSCIGFTITNPDTQVTEQGPLQYVGCDCSCNQYDWTETGMCPMCTHRHANGTTFGQRITFDNSWITSLIAYTQKLQEKKAQKKKPFPGSRDVYGNPEGGAMGDEGIPGDWWGEGEFPSQGGSYDDGGFGSGGSQGDGGFSSLFGGGDSGGSLFPSM